MNHRIKRRWKPSGPKLHAAMPELGDGVEVIETATPRTFYESTRRKFGMVGAPAGQAEALSQLVTPFPNDIPGG
jgi:hypothetical protein